MTVTFDEATKALLDGKNFPVVATVSPDGTPQSSVVWAKRDGETLVFATGRHRPKGRNLAHNPRVSVSLYDRDNPYQAAEIRGTAELLDSDPIELLNELAHKYTGQPWSSDDEGTELVVIRITPEKVIPFRG
jgi:PPOX class probable F420-dependent enzyme